MSNNKINSFLKRSLLELAGTQQHERTSLFNFDSCSFRALLKFFVLCAWIENDAAWLESEQIIIPFRLTLWADVKRDGIDAVDLWFLAYVENVCSRYFSCLDPQW